MSRHRRQQRKRMRIAVAKYLCAKWVSHIRSLPKHIVAYKIATNSIYGKRGSPLQQTGSVSKLIKELRNRQ